MIIGFIGRMGQGKTLSMTALGYFLARQSGCNLRSRHNVKNAVLVDDVAGIWGLENEIFLWDEIWVDMDSRDWKNNIDLTQFIQQSRKKNVILMYTAQHFSQVEKRLRNASDMLIFCDKNIDKKTGKQSIQLKIVDAHTGFIAGIKNIWHPEAFYNLYNTYEVISPLRKPKAEYHKYNKSRY